MIAVRPFNKDTTTRQNIGDTAYGPGLRRDDSRVLRMARLEAMGNRRRLALFGPPLTGREYFDREQAIRTALKAMRRGGVDIDRAPQEALDLVLAARAPEQDSPQLRERKPRSRSNPEHAQLLWPHGRGKWRGPGARWPK